MFTELLEWHAHCTNYPWLGTGSPHPVLERRCDLNENILLITGNDDTYRQPLLEAQGYSVRKAQLDEAASILQTENFHLLLVTTESGIDNTLAFCAEAKTAHPSLRVGILAQRSEYIPPHSSADVVVRAQYSPAKLVAAIKRLLEAAPGDVTGVLVEDDLGD